MIPQSYIIEWSNNVPWQTNEQVEQDLVICRALTELFKDEFLAGHLAFRGGTALHKLYLSPQPRYSEDIDLVQIKAENIKETLDKIRKVLTFLGEPKVKQKENNNTLIFRFESEMAPVMGGDASSDEIGKLAGFLQHQTVSKVKVGWYSGKPALPPDFLLNNFQYVKLGPYIERLGGLISKTTNQRLYKIVGEELIDITSCYWK